MRLLRVVFLLALAVAALSVASHPASAQNIQVIQNSCDTLSFDPPLVRVSFAVLNLGTIPVCSVHLTPVDVGPVPAAACRIVECSLPNTCLGGCPPPQWICELTPDMGAFWHALPGTPCIFPFQKVEQFDIVLDPFYCCYRADFDDPSGQIFSSQLVCFECDKPVATGKTTWGKLKSSYR